MEIKKVALLGVGGIGSYFVWGLAHTLGEDFCVVADGPRAARLRQDGIRINGTHYSLNVATPEEARGCDLLIVAVKYYHLASALKDVQTIVGPHTMVLSLLNGIDSEEILSEAVGAEHLIYSSIRFSVQRQGLDCTFDPSTAEGLLFGEKDHAEKTSRILALEEFFAKTPLRTRAIPNIVEFQWKKFMINISGNIPQAVVGVGYGAYFDSEHMAEIRISLQQEVQRTAAAFGIHLELPDPTQMVFPKSARFSTLQDLDAKRHTEIDMFLGVLIEKAASVGLDLPCSKCVYHLIKALEEKNDGLFDY